MVASARMRGHNEKFWDTAAKKCGTEKAVSEFFERRNQHISPINPGNHMALRRRRVRALNAATQREHQENQYDET
jgi:hypothetical protein